jgi:hypothetical protein
MVTEALRQVRGDDKRPDVTVTVVAVAPGRRGTDVLAFSRLRLVTCE